MNQPLEGLLVVALEQAVAAPFCTSRLADAGARVIKIERPEGDFARGYDEVVKGQSAYFVWLNRGKESICLNIKDDEDGKLLMRMVSKADVFIQNLAPGAAQRAGFDSRELRASYPRLITVDITGYGEHGPYRDMKAYDLLVQCETGLASVTGSADQPGRVGVSVCDIACGMYAHTAVLEALMEREKTGIGKGLHVSLFDAMADWMTVPLLHQDYAGKAPKRVGLNHPSIAPYGAYPLKDGLEIVIAIQNNREWRMFCEQVLNKPKMVDSDLYRSNTDRCRNRAAMDAEITRVFANTEKNDMLTRLKEVGIAYGLVNDPQALSNHPQLRRCSVDTPNGIIQLVAPPANEAGAQEAFRPVPDIGQHSDAIRAEFSA